MATKNTVQKIKSQATTSQKLESVLHDGSNIETIVKKQKKADLEKSRQAIVSDIKAIVDRRKSLKDQDLGSFLSDTSDLLIRRDQNIKKPTFRKIVLVKRFAVVSVLTGKVIDTVFIDKLGLRVYDETSDRGYCRYSRKDKQFMIECLAKKHNTEIYLKEDNLTRLRFNEFSIDRVSHCAIDRPYNGDPVIHNRYMVIKNENNIIGIYESLDLAKYACLNN